MITDFSKYKRVFAFGCSFTCWVYSTWADLIFKSCPNATCYNFGKAGGGNVFIANRLTEANKKFKFNEDDLILVMWSTFARLDVWKRDHRWITPGNIYSQSLISKQTVDEVIDLDGVLIRDLSIIELATTYLNNLPCDVIKFMSVPPSYDYDINGSCDNIGGKIHKSYDDTITSYGSTLYEFLGNQWTKPPYCYEYVDPAANFTTDYHPRIIDYLAYLQHHNLPVTQATIDYATQAHEFLAKKDNKSKKSLLDFFADEGKRQDEAYLYLW